MFDKKDHDEFDIHDEIDYVDVYGAPKKKHMPTWLGIVVFLLCVLVVSAIAVAAMAKMIGISPTHLLMNYRDGKAISQEGDLKSVVNSRTEGKMRAIERLVDQYYYLEEVSESELEEGAYRGMIDALGDKYAEYYTAEELQEVLRDNEGVFYGIGAYISIDQEKDMPFLSGIMEGCPAEEAGLHAGDIIMEVEGESTVGLTLTEVVAKVRGPEDTVVKLTMFRDGETFVVDVVRKKVNVETVKYHMETDEIGYIQIREFDDITIDQFTDAYATIKGKNAKALILDLRGNPGGLLDAVVEIARQILPEGLIVYTEDKAGHRDEYSCDGTREIQIPLVVLTDSGSASASEILTGAIKDYGVGTIMGTKTYGKGIVQNIFSLSDGSAVKMTISAYYTPKGNNIHGIGIEPDIEVPFDAEAYYDAENSVDNQLEAAKEYLQDILH